MKTNTSLTHHYLLIFFFIVSCSNSRKTDHITNAPGGMHRFSCSIGSVDVTSETNWVRLANYSFSKSNEVWESHWHWTQRRRVKRINTGIKVQYEPNVYCDIRTAQGYGKNIAPKKLKGTYVVHGDTLRIDWSENAWYERWLIDNSNLNIASLIFLDSNFGATHGWGYGSNAEWTEKVELAELLSPKYAGLKLKYDYKLWKTEDTEPPFVIEIDSVATTVDFPLQGYEPIENFDGIKHATTSRYCSTSVTSITILNMAISIPSVSENGRRNTWEHWCKQLAVSRSEECYGGNSHVKPMIQIIDNNGEFHGWVGVEASINETVPDLGAKGDDIGIFVISDLIE